jgi:protein scribble
LNKHSDKSFSFLSADEIEKLKQENEKKIATITRETKKKFASSTTTTSDNINNNNDQFDINEDDFYHNKNLIISQHEINDEDEDENVR